MHMMDSLLPSECPCCGLDQFRRDTETKVEFLEVGIDGEWEVIGEEDLETDEPNHFVYCANCFSEVRLDKDGTVILVSPTEKGDAYVDQDNL